MQSHTYITIKLATSYTHTPPHSCAPVDPLVNPECVEPMLSQVLTNEYCGLLNDYQGAFSACMAKLDKLYLEVSCEMLNDVITSI